MITELLQLPWVQNAQGALMWVIILLSALGGLFKIVKEIRQDTTAARERRDKAKDQSGRLNVDAFGELSEQQKTFLQMLLNDNKELRARIEALEKENRALREEIDEVRQGQIKSQKTLERIDDNTRTG